MMGFASCCFHYKNCKYNKYKLWAKETQGNICNKVNALAKIKAYPQQAASTIAIQNASVIEGLINMSP